MDTDVVIPFVPGPDDSIELRMALRSIEKNVAGNVVVWLIGHSPKWARNIRHVKMDVEYRAKFQKFHDLMRKIEAVCGNAEIGQRFIYTYDDIYFLNAVGLEFLRKPRALHDTAKDASWDVGNDASGRWKDCMRQTLARLHAENLPVYNYETHMPRVYNKTKALAILEKYDHRNFAFQFSTMYFNNYYTDPDLISSEAGFKLAAGKNTGAGMLRSLSQSYKMMNANIYRTEVMGLLGELFPKKCGFEK